MTYHDIKYPIPKHVRKQLTQCIEQGIFYCDLLTDVTKLNLKGKMTTNELHDIMTRHIEMSHLYYYDAYIFSLDPIMKKI